MSNSIFGVFFFFQAEDGIRDLTVTGVQTCALPICILGEGHDLSRCLRSIDAERDERVGETGVREGELGILLQRRAKVIARAMQRRSEEHTSELQSQSNLVCRLLLEKKEHYVSGKDFPMLRHVFYRDFRHATTRAPRSVS